MDIIAAAAIANTHLGILPAAAAPAIAAGVAATADVGPTAAVSGSAKCSPTAIFA
jgi:hypothetical protein